MPICRYYADRPRTDHHRRMRSAGTAALTPGLSSWPVVDARFSALAGLGCLLVAILTALASVWPPSILFALLSLGFFIRAADGYRSR